MILPFLCLTLVTKQIGSSQIAERTCGQCGRSKLVGNQGNNVSDSSTSFAERKDISSLRRTLAAYFETLKLNGKRVVALPVSPVSTAGLVDMIQDEYGGTTGLITLEDVLEEQLG